MSDPSTSGDPGGGQPSLAGPDQAGTRSGSPPLPDHERRVRLQTLVISRWIAVAGQTFALLFVRVALEFEFAFFLCLGIVAASAVLNLAVSLSYPTGARLSNRGATLSLCYDVLQLAALLYLTGGLDNPFALLLIVPVTISATVLSFSSTLLLVTIAVAIILLLSVRHQPLPWVAEGFALPGLYVAGIASALTLGVVFITVYAWRVAAEARRMQDALAATHLALAREQQLSALGALAAATAHELGTPLGTIKLISHELVRDVEPGSPYREDISILATEADRCARLLAELTQQPESGHERPLAVLGLRALVASAAERHQPNGIVLRIVTAADNQGPEPRFVRLPETEHGLGNLIENALDFAAGLVEIRLSWDDREARIEISDDGPGIPFDIMQKLGEPYVSTRTGNGGMGLGVFIAKTLLERTGAEIRFGNERDRGAKVVIVWPRGILEEPGSP